jgi:hypothetical protein
MIKSISIFTVTHRLKGLIGDRRAAGCRHHVERKVRLPIGFTGAGPSRFKTLRVHTLDISEGGLSVLSDGADVCGLASGGTRELCLILSLPGRPARIRVRPAHSRRLDESRPEEGCVVGLRITEMASVDRRRLRDFLGQCCEKYYE